MWAAVLMHALQQGRGVFNPLPLSEKQNAAHVPRLQEIAKAAYSELVRQAVAPDHQSKEQEDERVKLRECLSSLNLGKTQGLWWNQDLEKKTSEYWEAQLKASESSEFLHESL